MHEGRRNEYLRHTVPLARFMRPRRPCFHHLCTHSAWLVDVDCGTNHHPSVCAATASGALLVDDEEGCPAQCAGEFLSRRASGRPPLATAAASELLSNILGGNEPRLVGPWSRKSILSWMNPTRLSPIAVYTVYHPRRMLLV